MPLQRFCRELIPTIFSANLGGGGLATPYTANAASAGSYAIGAFVALFGGPIVGKIGLKWTMLLGAATFPLKGSSMWVISSSSTTTFRGFPLKSWIHPSQVLQQSLWYSMVFDCGLLRCRWVFSDPSRRGFPS